MPLSPHDRNKRRAQIVRRWAAYRAGEAQREIWRKRREQSADEADEVVAVDDLLAELPDGLIG